MPQWAEDPKAGKYGKAGAAGLAKAGEESLRQSEEWAEKEKADFWSLVETWAQQPLLITLTVNICLLLHIKPAHPFAFVREAVESHKGGN